MDSPRVRTRIRSRSGAQEHQPYVTHAEQELALSRERDPRRRALVRFLWLTGCRVSEALKVLPADLDRELALVRLATLKRGRVVVRTIPLEPAFLAELVALGPGRIFPWTRQHAYGVVRYALEMAGVDPGRCHPHALRHGHAMHALRSGAPLATVSRALGHANIATTSEYLKATAEDVRRDYARVRW